MISGIRNMWRMGPEVRRGTRKGMTRSINNRNPMKMRFPKSREEAELRPNPVFKVRVSGTGPSEGLAVEPPFHLAKIRPHRSQS